MSFIFLFSCNIKGNKKAYTNKREKNNNIDTYESSGIKNNTVDDIPLRLFLKGGEINGTELYSSNRTVTVSTSSKLKGYLRVKAINNMGSNSVAPLGATVTWGNKKKAYWEAEHWIETGENTYKIPVNVRAPSTPGTYYIIVRFDGEFNMAQIMSSTNWDNPDNPVWNDGNDVYDWSNEQIKEANSKGAAWGSYLFRGGYQKRWLAATCIKIIVQESDDSNYEDYFIGYYMCYGRYYYQYGSVHNDVPIMIKIFRDEQNSEIYVKVKVNVPGKGKKSFPSFWATVGEKKYYYCYININPTQRNYDNFICSGELFVYRTDEFDGILCNPILGCAGGFGAKFKDDIKRTWFDVSEMEWFDINTAEWLMWNAYPLH